MRYHFFSSLLWFPYRKVFLYLLFLQNCGFSSLLLLLQIGVLYIFFFSFLFARSRLFIMEGWMDGGWMHRWMGVIPVFYFGKRGGLLFFALRMWLGWYP